MGWATPCYATASTLPPGSFTYPSKPFRCLLLQAYLSPTALDRKEGYLLSTTHSVHWNQNLESNQALMVYETLMRIGASGIWMRIRRLELGSLSLWGSGGHLTHPQYSRCFQHTWALSQLPFKSSQVGTWHLVILYKCKATHTGAFPRIPSGASNSQRLGITLVKLGGIEPSPTGWEPVVVTT